MPPLIAPRTGVMMALYCALSLRGPLSRGDGIKNDLRAIVKSEDVTGA